MAIQPVFNESIPSLCDIKINAYFSSDFFYNEKICDEQTHIHSCYEIYVNVSGDVSFLHDRDVYDIRSGDVVISHPADVHYCIYRSPCVHEHFCVFFLNQNIGDFLERRGIRGRIRPSKENRDKIMNDLRLICSEDTDPFVKSAKLIGLIDLFDTENEKSISDKVSDNMRLILEYIDEHLSEIDSISEVASAFFIAESTLYRMFRTQLGISFNKYIEAQRLALSERLLRADSSVTDACFLAGFTDCSRFIAKFKNKFGKTPLKYKKEVLGRR